MKTDPNETYEDWINRSVAYEKLAAQKCLDKGENADTVLEEFSRRLMSKLLHPLNAAIRAELTVDNQEKIKQNSISSTSFEDK